MEYKRDRAVMKQTNIAHRFNQKRTPLPIWEEGNDLEGVNP